MDTKKVTRKVGTILSTKMQNTAVVAVDEYKKHALYHKRVKSTRKFHVHNPNNEYQEGQKVEFQESRKLSKTKNWIITKAIQ